jgi:carbon storage regulator
MLVLSRKLLEGIVIGSDIRITVVKVDRNQVRLGIEAPSDVVVVREELTHDPEHIQAREAWDSSEIEIALEAIHEPTPASPSENA